MPGRIALFLRSARRRLSIKMGDALVRLALSRKFSVKHAGFAYNVYYSPSRDNICHVLRFSRAFFSRQRSGIPKTAEVRAILSLIEREARQKGFEYLEISVDTPFDKLIRKAKSGFLQEEGNWKGSFSFCKKLK